MLGMITINLLPEGLRSREKTPLSRFIALLAGIVILLSTVLFFLYFRYSLLEFAKEERNAKQEEQTNVNNHHKKYTALIALKKRYEERGQTIQNIRYSRIRWGLKLMDFYDFFSMEAFRDKAWIDGLSMTLTDQPQRRGGRNSGPAPAGDFEFTLHTAGNEIANTTDFREALRGELVRSSPSDLATGAQFWEEFMAMSPPAPKLEIDEALEPPASYVEKISLDIKPREETKKAKQTPPTR